MHAPGSERLSVDAYLTFDATSTDVLEYRDGFVVELAVPTRITPASRENV